MSDQDTTLLEPVDDASGSRTLPLLLGVVVVLALAAGAYFLFFASGSDDADPAVAVDGLAEPTADAAADDPAPEENLVAADDTIAADAGITALPTVTYEVFLSRDPFEPVVPEDVVPASETGDTTDQTQTGDDPDTTDPDSQTTPPTEGCTGQDEVVCNGHVVTLIDVTTDESGEPMAVIQVDTTIYEVREGDEFAGSFKLVSIESNRVRLMFGDVVFFLPEGESVLK